MICNIVERAGIEPATLTRVRPAFPLSYLPIYPLIAGIARPAHTTPRKGITHLSLSCILQAHTWCVLCRCRRFRPDFYTPLLARGLAHELALAPWPLVLWLSPRPAWAKIRNSLPLCPHAGLGTYIATFGGNRAYNRFPVRSAQPPASIFPAIRRICKMSFRRFQSRR